MRAPADVAPATAAPVRRRALPPSNAHTPRRRRGGQLTLSDDAPRRPPPCSAERGLSNYLLFERARADPKIAQHMVKTDKFADDEHGNLVRLEDGARPTSGGVVIGASGKVGAAAGAPGGGVGGGGERKALDAGGAQPQAPR